MYRISRPNKRGKIFDKKYKTLMQESNISSEHMLQYLQENGIINIDDVQGQMTKKRREMLLKQHPYDIWKGNDSRYRTYIADSTKKSGRRMIVKTYEESIIDYLVEYYDSLDESKKLENITLEKLYPKWQEYKELHTTASTYIRRIDNDWNRYYADTKIVKIPVRRLDKLALDTWAHQLIKDNSMTKKQYYNSTIIMRQSLDYAVDLNIIDSNPFSKVSIDGKRLFRKVKKQPDNTQVFLTDEVPLISKMAWEDFTSNPRMTHKLAPLAVLFQFQTGLRVGELCACKYDDMEKSDFIHIQRMYRYETNEITDHTKTPYSDRQVYLTERAKKYIRLAKEYQQKHGYDSDYIFSVNHEPLSPRSIEYLYKKYCNHAGIIHKSSHKSRKTYISCLIDGQVNLNTVREMVGHADERTTLDNYCFDRCTENEKAHLIENALIS